MKKFFLMFVILIISLSSVHALSIYSASQIEFESNNNFYRGPAFVFGVIDNGGNDVIKFSSLDNKLPDDYKITNSGTISSNFKEAGFVYPTKKVRTIYAPKEIGRRTYLGVGTNNAEWCFDNLGGDRYIATSSNLEYACIKYEKVGEQFELMTGDAKWTSDYFFTIDGKGTDTLKLTDTSTSVGKEYGNKNFFNAIVQTNGLANNFPKIDNKISLFYDYKTYSWKTINPNHINEYSSKQDTNNKLSECKGSWSNPFIDEIDGCINQIDNEISNLLVTRQQNNIDIVGSKNDFDKGKGSVRFDDGRDYVNPIVTLTINADKFTVYKEFGELEFVSIDYPEDMNVGYTYPIKIKIKEKGVGNADASIYYNCNDISLRGFESPIIFNKGQTKTLSGTITYAGNTNGCSDSECYIYVKNRNAVGTDDSEKINFEICPEDSCSEGESTCFGDTLRICTKSNGVYNWQSGQKCDDGCQIDGRTAYCKGVIGYCGDNICGLNEVGDKETVLSCKKDCYVPGVKNNVDNMMILLIVSGIIMVGVFVIKLKKEGYFNK